MHIDSFQILAILSIMFFAYIIVMSRVENNIKIVKINLNGRLKFNPTQIFTGLLLKTCVLPCLSLREGEITYILTGYSFNILVNCFIFLSILLFSSRSIDLVCHRTTKSYCHLCFQFIVIVLICARVQLTRNRRILISEFT